MTMDYRNHLNHIRTLGTNELLKRAKRIERIERSRGVLRVALLGSKSMQFLAEGCKYGFSCLEYDVSVYQSDYNGILSSVLDDASAFNHQQFDCVILIPDARDFYDFPPLFSSAEVCQDWVEKQVGIWQRIWDKISENQQNALILYANFVIDPLRLFGQMEPALSTSKAVLINRLNQRLFENRRAIGVDFEGLASNIGKNNWFDPMNYYLSKLPFRFDCLPQVVFELVSAFENHMSSSRKVLVLDLDNTLWGGVIADESVSGINLDPNNAVGEAFLGFQAYVQALYERGVILAVASKNDLDVAMEGLNHPNMILKPAMFASIQANWDAKSVSLQRIADALNLGIDAFVFFDDNPFEQGEVRRSCPDVFVIEVPQDPAGYIQALDQSLAFNTLQLTPEDLQRNRTYQADRERKMREMDFDDYNQYLKSLDMVAECQAIKANYLNRFLQLTNKSNQFNLRTSRYSLEELEQYSRDDKYHLIGISLRDCYSEYGMIACVVLRKDGDVCFIENWVMSCRVLKRGIEWMTANVIFRQAGLWACEAVSGEYLKTPKNSMVAALLSDIGLIYSDKENMYSLKLNQYIPKETMIKEKQQ